MNNLINNCQQLTLHMYSYTKTYKLVKQKSNETTDLRSFHTGKQIETKVNAENVRAHTIQTRRISKLEIWNLNLFEFARYIDQAKHNTAMTQCSRIIELNYQFYNENYTTSFIVISLVHREIRCLRWKSNCTTKSFLTRRNVG